MLAKKWPPVVGFICLALSSLSGGEVQASQSAVSEEGRWVRLNSTANTRDAGGYPVSGFSRVRWGRIYRSDRLLLADENDVAKLKSLGIRMIVDLRSIPEVEQAPDPESLRTAMRYLYFPIDLRAFPTIQEVYLDIITTYSSAIAGVFRALADPQNLPLLYHCAAGKDRTGIVTALIHRLLGVSREDIVQDYLLSNEAGYWTDPLWIESILQQVEVEGGIEVFLTNRGIERNTQAAVRANLLERFTNVASWEFYSDAEKGRSGR